MMRYEPALRSMTPAQVFKRVAACSLLVALGCVVVSGGAEAAVWYFSFMLSAGVLASALYSIYLLSGDQFAPAPLNPPTEITVENDPNPVLNVEIPGDLAPLIHRSEYRDMLRDFVKRHAHGVCCGGLSKEEITLMIYNIQHTQQEITTISYGSVEEFVTADRVSAVFDITGKSIRLLMCLAVMVSSHRVDEVKCDKNHSGELCAEIRSNHLLRDTYGDDEDEEIPDLGANLEAYAYRRYGTESDSITAPDDASQQVYGESIGHLNIT